MHRALEIHEILLSIFGYLDAVEMHHDKHSTLAALARTCRTFKEPALDVLWEQMVDPSQLVRCIPEASYRQSLPTSAGEVKSFQWYSFRRSLTQTEWNTLRSYTRRIRYILIVERHDALARKSIRILSRPPTTETLFPNVRRLHLDYPHKAMPLFRLPLPSLVSLNVTLDSSHSFEKFIRSFAKIHPNLRGLGISVQRRALIDLYKINPNITCRWQSLEIVDCAQIFLDGNTLVYLSRMPALTRLSFSLSSALPRQIPPSDTPLIFSHLHDIELRSIFLDPISRLLFRIQLPTITKFYVTVDNCPSKQDFSSFLASVQTSGIGHTVQHLALLQNPILGRTYVPLGENRPTLGFEDFHPCMTFTKLRFMDLSTGWKIDLTDSGLLELASAWPHMECLWINMECGWNTRGGITPNGLLQLLQTCRSLSMAALALDTRGYTECHGTSSGVWLSQSDTFFIDVLDSFIETESVPATATLLSSIAPHPKVPFCAWVNPVMDGLPHQDVCKDRWNDVHRLIEDAVKHRS